MKSRRKTIPVRTARADLRVVARREPRHPVLGRLPMSLARALTEPPVPADEIVEVEEVDGEEVRMRRRAA